MSDEIFPVNNSDGEPQPIPMQGAYLWPVGRIKTLDNPRGAIEERNIAEMAHSIRDLRERGKGLYGTGILQALVGRLEPGAVNPDGSLKPDAHAIITYGETRYWGAKSVGLTHVPLMIEDETDESAYESAIYENLFRSNPKPLDFARALQTWMNRHDPPLSIRDAAKRLGKHFSWIDMALKPLKVNDERLRSMLTNRPDSLTALQRINTIRDEDVKTLMIDLVNAGFSYDSSRHFRQMETLDNETKQALIQKVRNQMETGKVDYSGITLDIRRARGEAQFVGDATDESAPMLPPDEKQVFGSAPQNGVPQVPTVRLVETMDSVNRMLDEVVDNMKAVHTEAATRKALRVRLVRLQELTASMERQLEKRRGK